MISHLGGPHGKSGTHYWGREVSTQFAQQFVTGMTAPPLVGSVVWNREDDSSLVFPFTEEEYKGIVTLKNKKAASIDNVLVEQLKNVGPRAHRWLHSMLNVCFTENRIPKVCRQSKIIAILKPGRLSDTEEQHTYIPPMSHV